MGAVKRIDDTFDSLARQGGEPEVELGFEWLPEEETEPWCVDDGARIVVMRTREIRRELGGGTLAGDVKVWRDGRARWLPAHEVYELRPDRDEDDTSPSRIRRVRRRHDTHSRDARPVDGAAGWWRRTLVMLFGR